LDEADDLFEDSDFLEEVDALFKESDEFFEDSFPY
jgi:hypothetical protein